MFINTVNPKICLIGVGKNNKFGHPSNRVIERLDDIKCKIYRTDLHGEVELRINKNSTLRIKTHIKENV